APARAPARQPRRPALVHDRAHGRRRARRRSCARGLRRARRPRPRRPPAGGRHRLSRGARRGRAPHEGHHMTDETFLARFEAASLPSFDHRDHLRVVFAYARRGGLEHAVARAREGLRRFAATHGEPGRYHETLTTAWARVVAHYALRTGDADF